MNKAILILGVVILIAGAAVAVYYGTGSTPHPLRTDGGIGAAVVGALIVAGGVLMKAPGASVKGQFACAKCGATFGSQAALDQHTKDKHGM